MSSSKVIKCCGCLKARPLAFTQTKKAFGQQRNKEFCQACAERLGFLAVPEKEPEAKKPKNKTSRKLKIADTDHRYALKADPILVADLYDLGFTIQQSGKLVGVGYRTAFCYLNQLGVQKRKGNPHLPPPSPQKLLELLNLYQWDVPQPLLELAEDWGLRPSEDSPVFAVQQRRVG